jgi:hypothetical protein
VPCYSWRWISPCGAQQKKTSIVPYTPAYCCACLCEERLVVLRCGPHDWQDAALGKQRLKGATGMAGAVRMSAHSAAAEAI